VAKQVEVQPRRAGLSGGFFPEVTAAGNAAVGAVGGCSPVGGVSTGGAPGGCGATTGAAGGGVATRASSYVAGAYLYIAPVPASVVEPKKPPRMMLPQKIGSTSAVSVMVFGA
jgi:hypothetical protein